MISIFYNKTSLNDTMTISVSSSMPVDFKKNEYGVKLIDANGDLVGINIFNLSKYINIPQGYLYVTKTLDDFIQEKFGVDIKKYHAKKFVVGQIKSLELIPDSHLTKCILDIGSKETQIVCGGKNLSEGIKVVVALPNVIMPNGKIINKSKLLGNDSNGMICSRKELFGTIENTDIDGHILILDDSYKIGDEYLDHYKNYKK